MKSMVLSVRSLFDGHTILKNQTVSVKDGLIDSITDCEQDPSQRLSGILVPGFIDIQVNGGGGYLFNQSPDVKTIVAIGKAHQRYGTTAWLPTLITDSVENMQRAAEAVASARESGVAGVLGIHFEGPHLSVTKKGVHPENFVRELSQSEVDIFTRKDLGKVVVTLAPENVAPSHISDLVGAGVIVCLGHSNATFQQTQVALKAGATGFTHLFNAMSPLTSREPGMVGAALLDKNSYCGLIMDGVHVHPEIVRLTIKVKSNLMLVTDAMPPAGSELDSFELSGRLIQRHNNKLVDQQGRLAGSTLTMAVAVQNCVEILGMDLNQAVNMASLNPARFLGLNKELGSLMIGKKASMVLLNKEGKVTATWIEGEQVF